MSCSSKSAICLLIAALVGSLAGCNPTASKPGAEPTAATADTSYRLTAEPSGAKGVKEVRKGAQDADEVTLFGRIGGDENPWVAGQAAFLVVDSELKPCNEKSDDSCKTPWDYCCDLDQLPTSKALVKVVDAEGKTVATDARALLGVKELQTVVVHGRAKRDEAGNLTVLADGVFVRN